jgi:hypothetical protein
VRSIAEDEALALYEAHPQWIDRSTMSPDERALLDDLLARFGSGAAHG